MSDKNIEDEIKDVLNEFNPFSDSKLKVYFVEGRFGVPSDTVRRRLLRFITKYYSVKAVEVHDSEKANTSAEMVDSFYSGFYRYNFVRFSGKASGFIGVSIRKNVKGKTEYIIMERDSEKIVIT